MRISTSLALLLCGVALAAPADAQVVRERRGFLSIDLSANRPGSFTDTLTYEAYVETATADIDIPSGTAATFGVTAGRRIWNRVGLAIGVSRGETRRRAAVDASVPHPLFDNQHRAVEGEIDGLTRQQTAAHVQVYFEPRLRGRTRVRLFAGPSYFNVEQQIVESIEVDETYPFDTASFRTARTVRAKGSGVGVHAGIDLAWMMSRRVGVGLLAQYGRANLDLNGPAGRSVSTDGGGAQVGGGLRVLF